MRMRMRMRMLMHFPILEDNDSTKFPLYVGLKFPSHVECRIYLLNYSVSNGYNLRFIKNDAWRLIVECAHEGCEWKLHASSV